MRFLFPPFSFQEWVNYTHSIPSALMNGMNSLSTNTHSRRKCYSFGLSVRMVVVDVLEDNSVDGAGWDEEGGLVNRTTMTEMLSVEKLSRAYLTRDSAASSGDCILRIRLTAVWSGQTSHNWRRYVNKVKGKRRNLGREIRHRKLGSWIRRSCWKGLFLLWRGVLRCNLSCMYHQGLELRPVHLIL